MKVLIAKVHTIMSVVALPRIGDRSAIRMGGPLPLDKDSNHCLISGLVCIASDEHKNNQKNE
jgi:hypothetical protein